MKIGTMRLEEAKAFDGSAGEYRIDRTLVIVQWDDGNEEIAPGWYWRSQLAHGGPFSTSFRALSDAEETLG